MNLNQLRFVVAVANSMSFSQAAKTCCVTQPTLSNGIAQLEDELGARLFDRTTRSVRLTPFGEHVLPAVSEVLDAQAELERGAQAYLDPALKMIRIGQSPLIDASLLATVLEPFKREYADVDIFFKECYLDDLDERIAEETIDFGLRPVLSGRPKNTRQKHHPFYNDELYLLPSDSDPIAKPKAKGRRLDAIAKDTFVITHDGCGLAGITEGLFEKHDLKLKKYPGQALSYQVLQDWANLGIGSAILPLRKLAPQNRDRALPLLDARGKPIRIQYELVQKKGRKRASHVFALHKHFTSIVGELVAGSVA